MRIVMIVFLVIVLVILLIILAIALYLFFPTRHAPEAKKETSFFQPRKLTKHETELCEKLEKDAYFQELARQLNPAFPIRIFAMMMILTIDKYKNKTFSYNPGQIETKEDDEPFPIHEIRIFTPSTHIINDLHIDSLGRAWLFTDFEELIGVEVGSDQIVEMGNIFDLSNVIAYANRLYEEWKKHMQVEGVESDG